MQKTRRRKLAARNGMFSHRWIDLCQRHGLDVHVIEAPWGAGLPADAYEAALAAFKERQPMGRIGTPEEIAASKTKMGLDPEKFFDVPEDVITHFRSRFGHLEAESGKWRRKLATRLDEGGEFEDLWAAVSGSRKDLALKMPEFTPGEMVATYYAQRSEAGLIVTEGTSPSPNGTSIWTAP